MTDSFALALRVGFSFALVLGLMWGAARALRGRYGDRGAGALEVLARRQVGRGASIAIVRVADQAIVVGITEQGITMLGTPQVDLAALTAAEAPAAAAAADPTSSTVPVTVTRRRGAAHASARSAPGGGLHGSILSPATWRTSVDAMRERTVRRG